MEVRLPVGTQVVTRSALSAAGRVLQKATTAKVVAYAEEGRYVIRTADGTDAVAERGQLSIRSHAQAALYAETRDDLRETLLRDHLVYTCVTGSQAYGLAGPGSDKDLRGVYVAPAELFWGFGKPPGHLEGDGEDEFFWEVERFCALALKGNPNVLEVLFTPIVEKLTPVGEELLGLRGAFLSQLVQQTFTGYSLSQFKKIEQDLRRDGEPKWKHVMHLVRLLMTCREVLRTGVLRTGVGADRDWLLAIKRGEVPWAEVEARRAAIHLDIEKAVLVTPLPALPDVRRVEDFLIRVRRDSLN